MSFASKSALKVEAKREAFRQWLVEIMEGPTPGLSKALHTALYDRLIYKIGERWNIVSNMDRDGPRNEGELPVRLRIDSDQLPPLF